MSCILARISSTGVVQAFQVDVEGHSGEDEDVRYLFIAACWH